MRDKRGILALGITALVFLGGWGLAQWSGKQADETVRHRLLSRAAAVARAVNPERIRDLSFSAADANNPAFQRLSRQLSDVAPFLRCRGVYTLAVRDGALVFGPESYGPDDPMASSPGTVHRKPAPEFFGVLETGAAVVFGPFRDEYGEFITAAAPVFDPRGGAVRALVAMDIDAADWRDALRNARGQALRALLPVAVVLVFGLGLVIGRHRKPNAFRGGWRIAEIVWIAALGLSLTTVAAFHMRVEDTQMHHRAFGQIAQLKTGRVSAHVHHMRDYLLPQVTRFYKGSIHVEPHEFHVFVTPLLRQAGLMALGWVQPVPARYAAEWEAEMKAQGPAELTVRPLPDGNQDPLYLLRYVEPTHRYPATGFDLGSIPEIRVAIEHALHTGLPVASPVPVLSGDLFGGFDLLVMHPVSPTADQEPGVALAALRLAPFLRDWLDDVSHQNPLGVLGLYAIRPGEAPLFLAGSHPELHAQHAAVDSVDDVVQIGANEYIVLHPLFAFGHAFLLAAHPGPAFWAAHPGWSERTAWLFGGLFTVLATVGAAYAQRRREILEVRVDERTAEERKARRELEESEAFNRAVLDHLPLGVAVNSVDPEVTAHYMNDEFPKIYRASRSALQDPDAFWAVVYPDPDFRQTLRQRVLEDCASGDPARMQWDDIPIVRPGEQTTYICARNIPVPDKPLMISTVWDVTDRVRHERERRGTIEFLGILLRSTELASMLREAAAWIRKWTGCAAVDIRLTAADAANPEAGAGHEVITEIPLTSDDAELGRLRFLGDATTSFDAREAAQLAQWAHSLVLAIQQRQSAEALRKSQRLSRIAGHVAGLGGWSVNLATGRVEWSDEVASIHGKPAGFSPVVEEGISFYAPEFQEQIQRVFEACAREGTPYDEVMQIVSTEGRRVWVRTIGEAERNADGTIVRVSGAFQDITARKELEQQLQQAQKLESVGRLAGGVAHDFNNMLQAILGNAELLLALRSFDEESRDRVREIQKAANRSAELTRQLLAFSRKQTVQPRVLDLNEAVQDLLKMLRLLLGKEIDLCWKPMVGPAPIYMDPLQINQIVANLAVNARDAMDGTGKLTIETARAELDEAYCRAHPDFVPGAYAVLSVSDDGRGMDERTQGLIFEPFFTTKPVGEGTGLGLATVFGIVRQNKGFIHVYSEVGKGSTFRVYLPLTRKQRPSDTPAQPVSPVGGGETLLVVEDEPAILKLAQQMLERLGYTVLTAGNPNEAIRVSTAFQKPIDLLLTDVIMPGMNGRDLCGRLSVARSGLRCLYMSGYTANVIVHRGILEEDMPFLQKPFSPAQLAKAVRSTLA